MTARWKDTQSPSSSPLEARARELFAELPDPPPTTEARRRAVEERIAAASRPRRWITPARVVLATAMTLLIVVGAVRWPRAAWQGELRIPDGAHTEISGADELRLDVDGPAELQLRDGNRRVMRLARGQLTVASGHGATRVEAGGAVVTLSEGARARVSLEGSRVIVAAYSAGVAVSWGERGGPSTTLSIGELWRSTSGVERSAPLSAPKTRSVAGNSVASIVHVARERVRSSLPPPAAAVPSVDETAPEPEAQLIGSVVQSLRARGDARAALVLLARYRERFPAGTLADEALRLEVEALVQLGRRDEALVALERAPRISADQRGDELRLLRGELRLDAHRARAALEDFAAVTVGGAPALVERAKADSARARQQLDGNTR